MTKKFLIPSDIDLLEEAKTGRPFAFRKLVERYEQQVRSIVIGMLGDSPELDEVAQDVFIRFYKSMEQYKGDAKLGTYLSKIAINLSLNELKRRKKIKSRWLSIFQKEEVVFEIKDSTDYMDRMETKNLVHMAIQKLEPKFRIVIILRLIEGYSVKEVSEILDLPMGTIASRLARAQKKLKHILAKLK